MALKTKKTKKIELPAKCGVKDLAAVYAAEHGCTQKDAEEAIRNTVDTICNALCTGHSVSVLGMFSLDVSTRAERQGRNPKTKEAITIPASKYVKFKAGATLKKALNP